MKKLFKQIGLLTLALMLALAPMLNAEAATNYPRRAVEMVIPFGAGSASDTFARQYALIAEK
ncbi:MAG: hypothetical protein IJ214_06430, partial [Clostridia bacterium]|nr:hypothetical protein [Clostridia bacterium]